MIIEEIKQLINKMDNNDKDVSIIVSNGEYSHFFNEIADMRVKVVNLYLYDGEIRLLFKIR